MKSELVHFTPAQNEELAQIESEAEQHVNSWKKFGVLMLRIWDGHLYANKYQTFKEYLKKRWQIGDKRFYQLVNAAKVVQNVSTVVEIPNERVARQLSSLPPIKQISAAKVLAQNPGKITSERAKSAVREVLANEDHPLPAPKHHPEMDLNLAPKMTMIAKAQAYATISEWYAGARENLTSHPMATPDVVVKRILALFK